jgi:lactate/malate dehydrogenase, alpha/beta C-terminal domain
MTSADRDDLAGQAINAGYRILHGKGHSNYAIALATARIIEAVLYDEHQVLPVSSLLTDYAGISDVCLSVPLRAFGCRPDGGAPRPSGTNVAGRARGPAPVRQNSARGYRAGRTLNSAGRSASELDSETAGRTRS